MDKRPLGPVRLQTKVLRIAVAAVWVAVLGVGARMAGAGSPTSLDWIQWTNPGSFPTNATWGSGSSTFNYTYASGAVGQLAMPDGSTVYVGLSGEVVNTSSASGFGQPSSYWSGRPYTGGGAAYISTNVPSFPTNGDRIGVVGNSIATQTLTFYSDSGRTTPTTVSNIVMMIYSLGSAATQGRWSFDRDFAILSDNTTSYGGFTRTATGGGYRLSSLEGSGAIQFVGSYSSISWDVLDSEAYAAWNIGVTSATTPTTTDVSTTTTGAGATTVPGADGDRGVGQFPQSGTNTLLPVLVLVLIASGGVLVARGRRYC